MYLSSTTLSFDIVGYEIDNSNYYKNLIWNCFHECADRNFLFLREYGEKEIKVTVCSLVKPKDFGKVKWQTVEIPDSYLNHDRYQFRLKASPVKRDGGKKDFPHPDLEAWLKEKAEASGFSIEASSFEENRWEFFKKKSGEHGDLYSVTFSGILNVIDREKFKTAFSKGVGRNKTYGFGMLCLKPIK